MPTGTYLSDFIRSCSPNNQQQYIIFKTIQLPIFWMAINVRFTTTLAIWSQKLAHDTTFCTQPHSPTPASSKQTKNHLLRDSSPRRRWFLYIGLTQGHWLSSVGRANRSQATLATPHPYPYYSAASVLGLGSSFTRLRICSTIRVSSSPSPRLAGIV